MLELQQVLVKPLITEKSTLLQEVGKYVFHVAPKGQQGPGPRGRRKVLWRHRR